MSNEINPAIGEAFHSACLALGGAEPDVKLMKLLKVDNTKDMVLICVARLTQEDNVVKVAISGQFQAKDGFASKVGLNFSMTENELCCLKGYSASDRLRDTIKIKMDDLFEQVYADWLAYTAKKVEVTDVKIKFVVGIDECKDGSKDVTKVTQSPCVVDLKPIDELTDREVNDEIEYLKHRNNIVGGIGCCGGTNETPEERRKGDLAALRALEAHLHREIKPMPTPQMQPLQMHI